MWIAKGATALAYGFRLVALHFPIRALLQSAGCSRPNHLGESSMVALVARGHRHRASCCPFLAW
jgi:hypothetical protein